MSILNFWYGWSSWTVELAFGSALGVLCYALARDTASAVALADFVSVFYEAFIDRNGWSWSDVGQRQVGILIGIAASPAAFWALGV